MAANLVSLSVSQANALVSTLKNIESQVKKDDGYCQKELRVAFKCLVEKGIISSDQNIKDSACLKRFVFSIESNLKEIGKDVQFRKVLQKDMAYEKPLCDCIFEKTVEFYMNGDSGIIADVKIGERFVKENGCRKMPLDKGPLPGGL